MNKLIQTNLKTFNTLKNLFGMEWQATMPTLVPDGFYFLTDESGLGVHGLASIIGGGIKAGSLARNGRLEEFILDDKVFMSEGHLDLESRVKGIPFDFEVFFDGKAMLVVFGDFKPIFRDSAWSVRDSDTTEWKSLLVEKNITEEALFTSLKKLEGLEFNCLLFNYSPVKGLHLP